MDQHDRDVLAHLANDWDAMAAQLDRSGVPAGECHVRAEILRECAGQLRDRLLQLRVPVPLPNPAPAPADG